MSNKIVPGIYRSVIDDVIASIKPEFEEYGVSEDVLADLQAKWEAKVIASHVADFEPQAPPPPPPHHAYPGHHPMHPMMPHYPPTHMSQYAPPPANNSPTVKSEPIDPRYILNSHPQQPPYTLPPLPTPPRPPVQVGGSTSVLSFPPGPPPTMQKISQQSAGSPIGRQYVPPGQQHQPQQQRIPQVDGPASSDEEDSDEANFAPRSTHPSLPQPKAPALNQSQSSREEEAINSDLDDTDTDGDGEEDEGAAGETDIVFCTYDKVARVKNKWKCILKDGMIHMNGKDYLFQKCTGEFEW